MFCDKIQQNEGDIMNTKFSKEVVERAVRTFVQGYLAYWMVNGADFDGLIASDSLKAGVVALALSVAMSLGLKNVGPNKGSASAV